MPANSFGERFCVTTFGESHGPALGVVIDGCPAGVAFNLELLIRELHRRRPGGQGTKQSEIVSPRNELDNPEVLSGIFEGKTLGTPIAIIVRNNDTRSQDYSQIKKQPRPGHADDVWKKKFGHYDHRGGGRSSGRETLSRVIAGAVARMLVSSLFPKTKVIGYSKKIGPIALSPEEAVRATKKDVDQFYARFPSSRHEEIRELLVRARSQGESYGGTASIVIKDPPPSLGQPVFHKLKTDLGAALLSLGAVNGFDLGETDPNSDLKGTVFHSKNESYGGIRGGLSTGESIFMNIQFKPTSSILDVAKKGRHDPCIVIRAIPVLEAMTWIVLAEHLLWRQTDRVKKY